MTDLAQPADLAAAQHPVLFYDGTCGFCAWSVRWFMARDPRGVLRFAPLQGSTYASLPIPDKPMDVNTIVLVDHAGLHVCSEASLRALAHAGGFWGAVARACRLIPRAIRDVTYRFIAARRHAIAGSADSCPIPTPAQRARFLP